MRIGACADVAARVRSEENGLRLGGAQGSDVLVVEDEHAAGDEEEGEVAQ